MFGHVGPHWPRAKHQISIFAENMKDVKKEV